MGKLYVESYEKICLENEIDKKRAQIAKIQNKSDKYLKREKRARVLRRFSPIFALAAAVLLFVQPLTTPFIIASVSCFVVGMIDWVATTLSIRKNNQKIDANHTACVNIENEITASEQRINDIDRLIKQAEAREEKAKQEASKQEVKTKQKPYMESRQSMFKKNTTAPKQKDELSR